MPAPALATVKVITFDPGFQLVTVHAFPKMISTGNPLQLVIVQADARAL